jgi:hypothetical protein
MTDPKLCKDCKYCRPDWIIKIISFGIESEYQFAKCARPISGDLVSGTEKLNTFCSCERVSYDVINTCGKDAKYFEAKK